MSDKSTVELCKEVAEIKGVSAYQNKLCVEDHPSDDVAKMCVSAGGHDVFDMLAQRGLRVSEVSSQSCDKTHHNHIVYVEPTDPDA